MYGTSPPVIVPPSLPLPPSSATAGPTTALAASTTAAAGGGDASINGPPSVHRRLRNITDLLDKRLIVDARITLEKCDRTVLSRLPVVGDGQRPQLSGAEMVHLLVARSGDVACVADQLAVVRELTAEVLDSKGIAGAWEVVAARRGHPTVEVQG